MGVVQGPLDVVDCGIRHPAAFENLQPFLRGLLLDRFLNEPIDNLAMLDTIAVGNKSGVCLPFREAQPVAQHTEKPVIATAEQDVSV